MFRLSLMLLSVAYCMTSPSSAADIDFARDVRPILSENCVFCHGPDEATREAGLRLDLADAAADVLEPGKSEHSELFQRIITNDPDLQMPPPHSNRSLTAEQIEKLRLWIDQGANWEQHWSFQPIVAPEVPEVLDVASATIRNPIDAFVQAKLQSEGWAASPAADRPTLIRRLSLDLTGLPPTPAEVQAFVEDRSADAYERLVERLLDSPAYGQRMAWDWLDAARYADTNGYQGDNERTMWPWRDWVVQAFNENLPYDQFTIWQLAGDRLPEATDQQVLATGFLRNHMINGEGGRIAEENRVEYVMDMSETMGTVWLGLTLNCCRCHDHKYDPLTNEEYYQFFAFFNQTPVTGGGGNPQTAPNLAVPSERQQQQFAALERQLGELDSQQQALRTTLLSRQAAWEAAETKRLTGETEWAPLLPTKLSASGSDLAVLPDRSVLSSSSAPPDNDTYTLFVNSDLQRITGLRLEALRHESFPGGSLSHADSGNFVLTEIALQKVAADASEGTEIEIETARATFEQGGLKIEKAFDDDPQTGWAVYEGRRVDRDHAAVFRLREPLELKADERMKIVLRFDSPHVLHNLGRFRLSVSSAAEPALSTDADKRLTSLRVPADQRSKAQQQQIEAACLAADAGYRDLQSEREALQKRRKSLSDQVPQVMVMADMPQPRKTFVLERGLYNQPTTEITAGLPAFANSPQESTSADRLTLARWLVDDDNPLTSRVTVNRFWQQVFGIGLVKTTEDFGAQGELPVHRELLDWLAATFRDSGWDVKGLMRLIVTSHTYRQTSRVTDSKLLEQDPQNRLLGRGARYRLPAWMLRDQALSVSGLLSPVSGGPAINTYQPPGVWEEASFGKKIYRRDSGEKLYRRSLYVFWRRITAPTMFFDNPSRQTCTVKASRTNTPLHALQTLNNTAFVEAARQLAESVLLGEPTDDGERIDKVFLRILAREATAAEQTILQSALQRSRQQYADQPEHASEVLGVGESARDPSLPVAEHAAWTNLCLAVLNLDETLNRE